MTIEGDEGLEDCLVCGAPVEDVVTLRKGVVELERRLAAKDSEIEALRAAIRRIQHHVDGAPWNDD